MLLGSWFPYRPRARLGCGQYRLLQNKDQKASDLTEEEGRPTDDINLLSSDGAAPGPKAHLPQRRRELA